MYKLKIPLFILATSISFVSCLKDDTFLDVSNTQPIIEFSFGTNGKSDLGNFNIDPTVAVLDTALAINIASPQVLDYDVTVTLKLDPSMINAYNSVSSNTHLKMLPDSAFKYTTTTITIPAGRRLTKVSLTLYPSKIDLGAGESFGLPISIISAKGSGGQNLVVSGNSGVAFYAFIANPLAGTYDVVGNRYNYTGSSGFSCGGPIPTTFVATIPSPTPKSTTTVDPTTVSIDYANLGSSGYQYVIAIDPNDATNVLVSSNAALDVASSGLNVTYCTHTYDVATKKIHIISTYTNGAGNDRVIDEVFTHQ